MPNAKLIQSIGGDTGVTVYAVIKCVSGVDIGKYLNDADGTFVTPAPADPYVSLTEDGTIKGLFSLSESRAAWTDGVYLAISYTQAGGSPAPASDTPRSIQELVIQTDEEVNLNDYVAPDNISITAIKAKTDNLPADPASNTEVDTRLATSGYNAPDNAGIAAIKTKTDNLPQGVRRNTLLAGFEFLLVDSIDGKTGKTGLPVTAQRSIDTGAFTLCINAVMEVGNGVYWTDIAADDLNGKVITFLFSAQGAIDRVVVILTV